MTPTYWAYRAPTTRSGQLAPGAAECLALYRERFGTAPEVGYVNPRLAEAWRSHLAGLRVVEDARILRAEVWLGRDLG
jgi:hypothetical protein